MSIKSIQEYVKLCLEGNSTIEKRYEIIIDQKEQLEKNLKEIHEQYEYLTIKSNMYLDIINKQVPDTSNPDLWNITNSET